MTEDPLLKYLLENSRPMTKEESEAHNKALLEISKPTGRNLFKEKLYTYNDLTVKVLDNGLWKVVVSNDADFPVGTEFIIGEGNQHKIKEKDKR